jgi:hypothetical protein
MPGKRKLPGLPLWGDQMEPPAFGNVAGHRAAVDVAQQVIALRRRLEHRARRTTLRYIANWMVIDSTGAAFLSASAARRSSGDITSKSGGTSNGLLGHASSGEICNFPPLNQSFAGHHTSPPPFCSRLPTSCALDMDIAKRLYRSGRPNGSNSKSSGRA